jgi:hypothetical protein
MPNYRHTTTAILLAGAASAWAQTSPSLGILYNTTETNSLVYRCSPPQGNELKCEITQTSVRPKATYADLASTVDNARKAFPNEKPWSAEECKSTRQIMDVLEGKITPPKADALASMSEVTKRDVAATIGALMKYCATPTEEVFLEMIRLSAEKDRRTCKVSSINFQQTFTRAEGSRSPPTWVAQSKPEGQCGIVQLSRFEPEVSQIGKGNFTNWSFVARKAITNPSGELFPGVKCSGLDERPYTYLISDLPQQAHSVSH